MNPIKAYSEIKKSLYNRDLKVCDILEICLGNMQEHSDLNAFVNVYTQEAKKKSARTRLL